MPTTSDNNKRIAKNTLMLYFRMLVMMAVSLYIFPHVGDDGCIVVYLTCST